MSAPWILMYHVVDHFDSDQQSICVSPERFRQQMAWLARRNLRGVCVAELRRAKATGDARGLVGLTFDDAYAGLPEHAVPVLRELGFSATVFAVARRLGAFNEWDEGPKRALLGASELAALVGEGIEIGSHGMTHARLTTLNHAELTREIAESRVLLSRAVGVEVTGFCYPYGAYNDAARRAVRDAGYDYACAYKTAARDRFSLPRTYAGDKDGSLRLWAKRGLHHLPIRPGSGAT